jgi:hypothetical protein
MQSRLRRETMNNLYEETLKLYEETFLTEREKISDWELSLVNKKNLKRGIEKKVSSTTKTVGKTISSIGSKIAKATGNKTISSIGNKIKDTGKKVTTKGVAISRKSDEDKRKHNMALRAKYKQLQIAYENDRQREIAAFKSIENKTTQDRERHRNNMKRLFYRFDNARVNLFSHGNWIKK